MTVPPFLVRLMASRGFYGRLGPEDREALAYANELRVATIEGRLRCIWTHPPMELLRKTPQSALAAALGAFEGTSDYLFIRHDGGMAQEFKSPTGRQRPGQVDFQAWCEMNRIPYFVVRSKLQGLTILRDHGWLT